MSNKKPTAAELASALWVMETLGDTDNPTYQAIAAALPAHMRPTPRAEIVSATTITGIEDMGDLSDSAYKKLNAAVKAAWTPVELKIGKRTFTVTFDELNAW